MTVRMDTDIVAMIDEEAAATGRNRSEVARERLEIAFQSSAQLTKDERDAVRVAIGMAESALTALLSMTTRSESRRPLLDFVSLLAKAERKLS
jgi:hypothetical protein